MRSFSSMAILRTAALAAALASAAAAAAPEDAREAVAQARKRWAESPHGPLLERILPPTFEPSQLPDQEAPGAQLVVRFCVQCHNLPNPAMHDAAKWPRIVDRMVLRMEGRGNLGELMQDMMAGVSAPSAEESRRIVAYLRKYALRPLDPKKYPDVTRPEGQAFRLACQQCHALPDPRRHTESEWRSVVARMERNMQWMNRVVGTRHAPDEPQLRVEEIIGFLARHARKQ